MSTERKTPGLSILLSLALILPLGALAAEADDGAARTRTSSSSSSSSSSSTSVSGSTSSSSSSSDSPRIAVPRSSDDSTRSRSRSRDRDSRHYRSYPYNPYYYPYSHGGWYGWYPSAWWGGWGWWGLGPNVVVIRDYDGYRGRGPRYGALDLDVHPEEAEIWIDGRRVGIADNFDGFPEYLVLPEGDHEIVIYHPGYRTIHREYAVYEGVLIEVDDRMDEGESLTPAEIFERETPRRDARVERNRVRREDADRDRWEEDWRRRERDAAPAPPAGESERRPAEARPVPRAETSEARLTLRVSPPDASIYLDGEFLGLAEDWADFYLSPGSHRIDVVRPGYESVDETVDLEPGETEELRIELDED